MAVSYRRLFHVLIDRGISNARLQKMAGYSANITTRLKNNTYVSLVTIEKICRVLDCRVDDIVEFIPDEESSDKNA
jgi:putative transcriptional regulator